MQQLNESRENYLETILILKKRIGLVRAKDIANELDFAKSSVSIALKKLQEDGYVKIDEEGYITLCKRGRIIAQKMYERHKTITNWLISLGVGPITASKDACRMEHVISTQTFEAIKKIASK